MPEQFVDVLPGFLRAHPQDAVITKLLVDDLEFQFTFDERPCQIPTDRNGNPCFGGELVTEEALLRRLGLVGTTGWRWKAKQTIFGVLDFDALNHGDGHDEATLLRVVEALRRVGYAWVRHSKGGFGLHGIIPCRPMVAATGKAHTLNVNAIIDRVCADADFDFRKFLCSNQVGFFWTPDDFTRRTPSSCWLNRLASHRKLRHRNHLQSRLRAIASFRRNTGRTLR